jgi:acetolactate synthase regulatory subunit
MSAQKFNSETACFTITAAAAPGVLPRVLLLFAKRGLVPDRFDASCTGAALTVDIQMHDMDPDLAQYIGRCLNEIIEVDRVLVSEKRYADVA